MNLIRVDVDDVWDEAEPLLAGALAGSDDTTAEVYAACKAGAAWLVLSDKVFIVLTQAPYKDGFALLLWVGASRGPTDCMASHLGEIEAMARGMGAAAILFRSQSQAFGRILGPAYKVKQVTWYREF